MSVSLRSLSKRFGAHKALSDVSLEIETGSFFVILGPSGCGKSTLLRLIAGLETQDSGEIDIDGRRVAGAGFHVPPEDRDVGVVFQSYALWPHMSVEANVAFPVESAGLSARDRKSRVERSLETVGLDGFAKRKPASLSGGQRQRVALARCLAQAAGTVVCWVVGTSFRLRIMAGRRAGVGAPSSMYSVPPQSSMLCRIEWAP